MATVTCVRCGCQVAFERADVVGTGYRCDACTLYAQREAADGIDDLSDHLPAGDREELLRRKTRIVRWGTTALVLAIGGPAVAVGMTWGVLYGLAAGFGMAQLLSNPVALVGESIADVVRFRRSHRGLPAARVRALPPRV